MSERAASGRAAETRARHHLEAAGLRLRHANYQCRRGELDLIMETAQGQIVFVEVRYRARSDYGGAAASVDARKCQRLIHAATTYIAQHKLTQRPSRFDVVAIDGHGQVDWIVNAFDAD